MPAHPTNLADVAVQLLKVFALVLANGFFVVSEFALVAVRRTRIDQLAAEGNHSAVAVQRAVREISRYIAATQVGVTVASLLLGGLGEKILEPLMLPLLGGLPDKMLGVTRAGLATGCAYLVMTTMHVVIGELMPKCIALQKAEKVALIVVRPITLFVKLVTPLVWMLNTLGNFLLRLMGIQATDEHLQVHSPEELEMIFAQSHQGGEINATEFEILHRVVRFSDVTAREAMVPRVEMQAIPLQLSRARLSELLRSQPHTRVPVYQGSLDEVVGVAHLKDLVRCEAALRAEAGAGGQSASGQAADEMLDLQQLGVVREAVRVPETISIDRLLVEFKNRRQQMAIVIDEFGGTAGLVTMGDLLEQAFGDVHDEFDHPEPEIAPRPDGRIHLQGRVLVDELNERYGLGLRSDEADTIGGLVFSILGRPAVVGDEVEINGARLRVEAVDRLRLTELSLQLPNTGDDPPDDSRPGDNRPPS